MLLTTAGGRHVFLYVRRGLPACTTADLSMCVRVFMHHVLLCLSSAVCLHAH